MLGATEIIFLGSLSKVTSLPKESVIVTGYTTSPTWDDWFAVLSFYSALFPQLIKPKAIIVDKDIAANLLNNLFIFFSFFVLSLPKKNTIKVMAGFLT